MEHTSPEQGKDKEALEILEKTALAVDALSEVAHQRPPERKPFDRYIHPGKNKNGHNFGR